MTAKSFMSVIMSEINHFFFNCSINLLKQNLIKSICETQTCEVFVSPNVNVDLNVKNDSLRFV